MKLRDLGVLPQLYQLASFDPPEQQIAVLQRVQPQMISAYAVGLELLAGGTDRGWSPGHPPPHRVHQWDGPHTAMPGLAKRAFGVEPFDVYAANEVGPIAWECPVHRGALHLNDDTQDSASGVRARFVERLGGCLRVSGRTGGRSPDCPQREFQTIVPLEDSIQLLT